MLAGSTYDVGVMVMFLFQMVFMDTALTIVTGTAAERWKYSAFIVSSFVMGAFTYPLFANWAWGGGWLQTLGANFGLGHGYADFAGSGVVHSVGGITALAMGILIGPAHRQVHARRQAERDSRSRHHDGAARLLHPGVRVVRVQSRVDAGRLRPTATCASAPSRSTRCWPGWPGRSAPCSTCGVATASLTPR